jgi:5'-nucleotidase
MNILLSNDDGVYARGLNLLAEAIKDLADIRIIAPDRNCSAASNSLTIDRPLRVKTLPNGAMSVEGTPTDCVHLAITGLLETLPDMVISGINDGSNLGDDTIYSGTVAAAMEGRFMGLPAIAISLVGKAKHVETAAQVARELVLKVLKHPLAKNTVLNVNVPDVPYEELTGWEVVRLGRRHMAEKMIKAPDPRGNEGYWVGNAGPEQDAGEGTDFYAISQKRVSITPLLIDLTNFSSLKNIAEWAAAR